MMPPRWRPTQSISVATLLTTILLSTPAWSQDFTYNAPGSLVAGSGQGRVDNTIYIPNMRFPIEAAPAYLNSQVWGHGGISGPGGGQCDAENYSYPWWDNYCEGGRSWDMPLCPQPTGHQGQDMRPSTCADDTHWAVAAEAGTITSIGSYSVWLTTAAGVVHRYLHMDPGSVAVSVNDTVAQGDRLGRVSNAFGMSSTTIHLHYDIQMNVDGVGFVYVPGYLSLVTSYERLLGSEGELLGCRIPSDGATFDNQPEDCFTLYGPSATWRYVDTLGHDGDLYWSNTWDGGVGNWAQWVFFVEETGEYEVEVYIEPNYAASQQTRYTVLSGSDEADFRVDQSAADGWLTIGSWTFQAGIAQNVSVYDGPSDAADASRLFVADALRLTPLGTPPEDVGAPDLGTDTGGVADTGVDTSVGVDTSTPPDTGPTISPDTSTDLAVADTTSGAEPEPSEDGKDVTVSSGCGCRIESRRMRAPLFGAGLLLSALFFLARRRNRGLRL